MKNIKAIESPCDWREGSEWRQNERTNMRMRNNLSTFSSQKRIRKNKRSSQIRARMVAHRNGGFASNGVQHFDVPEINAKWNGIYHANDFQWICRVLLYYWFWSILIYLSSKQMWRIMTKMMHTLARPSTSTACECKMWKWKWSWKSRRTSAAWSGFKSLTT